MDDVIQTVESQNGVPIRLTYKQWAHIVESHDYMAGYVDAVLETLSEPDYIVQGWTDELIALKYYGKTIISEKYAVVVYRELNGDGFVITAFMTSQADKILKRGVLWQR